MAARVGGQLPAGVVRNAHQRRDIRFKGSAHRAAQAVDDGLQNLFGGGHGIGADHQAVVAHQQDVDGGGLHLRGDDAGQRQAGAFIVDPAPVEPFERCCQVGLHVGQHGPGNDIDRVHVQHDAVRH